MSKTRLSFSSLSLKWFLLGFDTLTIMHEVFFLSFRPPFLSPPLSCCVCCRVRKMTTLNETTTLTTTKRKRKRTRKFDDDDASSLQKPNANNAKRMKMKNDEKEETKTNLLGILVEATDCASPLVQIKTTKKDDESTPPPLPFPSRNPPPLETDKNDDDDENFELENIQNSKIEEEDQKEAKRRSNAQQPDEEEKEELKEEEEEETTFTTTKTSSIIDDEATTAIESIAKAAPKQGLKMFVQWLDALVFDLKSRAATLKRSKKRAQKAFLRMQKEEKKKYGFSLESASAKTKGTKKIKKNIKSTRDLKMLRALEDFWGVELSETEKSLERARATLKAHTLMLAVEKDDERAILASAVAFYRTSFGLISEHVVVKRE